MVTPNLTAHQKAAMGITRTVHEHVAEVVVDVPPVNALTVAQWFELASVVTDAGADPDDLQALRDGGATVVIASGAGAHPVDTTRRRRRARDGVGRHLDGTESDTTEVGTESDTTEVGVS